MFPIVLDPAKVRILLAGQGPLLDKRRKGLEAAGARPVVVKTPTEAQIRAAQVVFVAGLDDAENSRIANAARAAGALVNVEDVLPLCDFHTPAIVRRGGLLLSISTGGRSPALAKMLREFLEAVLPPVWAERLERLGTLRDDMRARGAGFAEISTETTRVVEGNAWLCTQCRAQLPVDRNS
ncbi:MAG: siroheme synthase [Alphaproteobacteria bacterium]|jgi:precorrin-2 dehydrogenase/sirohydrochlorin ferrochelatase|nr:siroheme synthase [Alphaproteobacteria bacterium]